MITNKVDSHKADHARDIRVGEFNLKLIAHLLGNVYDGHRIVDVLRTAELSSEIVDSEVHGYLLRVFDDRERYLHRVNLEETHDLGY